MNSIKLSDHVVTFTESELDLGKADWKVKLKPYSNSNRNKVIEVDQPIFTTNWEVKDKEVLNRIFDQINGHARA